MRILKRLLVCAAFLVALCLPGPAQAQNFLCFAIDGTPSCPRILFGDGTAAAPAMAFVSQPGTGARYAGNALYLVTQGVDRAIFDSTGFSLVSGDVFLNTNTATLRFGAASDVIVGRESAAVLQTGADAAGVTDQMLKGPDRITSAGVGGNLTIAGGRGFDTGLGGSIIFQTAPAAGAGVAGVLATALTIDSTKLATFAGPVSAVGTASIAALNLSIDGAADSNTMLISAAKAANPVNIVSFRTARGYIAAPTATQLDDIIGGFNAKGATANNTWSVSGAGGLFLRAAETFGAGTEGTYIQLRATTIGAASNAEHEVLRADGSGPVSLMAAGNLNWTGRSIISSPANGQWNLTNAAATAGIGFDVTTDALLKVRTRAHTGDAAVSALTLTLSGPAATIGSGVSSTDLGSVRRLVSKYSVTSLVCVAPFQAAAVTADCVIATLPIKTRLVAIYAETTVAWTCSGTCTGTKTIGVGKSAGGVEYLKTGLDVAATGQWGLADADMGSEMTRAAAIQGSALVNWAATIPVTVRFTSGTGNWGSGSATYVNAGATVFYLVTEALP